MPGNSPCLRATVETVLSLYRARHPTTASPPRKRGPFPWHAVRWLSARIIHLTEAVGGRVVRHSTLLRCSHRQQLTWHQSRAEQRRQSGELLEFVLWLFGGGSKADKERWTVWLRFVIFSVVLLVVIGFGPSWVSGLLTCCG